MTKEPDNVIQASGPACKRGSEPRKPVSEDPAITLIIPVSPAAKPGMHEHGRPLIGEISKHS
jgi:hypothetical protein